MPAQLLALDDNPSILLDKPILLLGRHPECDIQIDSRKISRRHCCIAQVNNYLVVRDLGSTNGIRINGIKVQEGRLADGDELTLGTTRYQVNWNLDAEKPAAPKALAAKAPPPVEDDLLESSDEPVPLPDPNPDEAPLRMDDVLDDVAGPPAPRSESPILPEDLDLMPVSSINLRMPASPPLDANS